MARIPSAGGGLGWPHRIETATAPLFRKSISGFEDSTTKHLIATALLLASAARMLLTMAASIPLPALRQLGNILRHEYGEVDLRLIYGIVVERMPVLRAACDRALSKLER